MYKVKLMWKKVLKLATRISRSFDFLAGVYFENNFIKRGEFLLGKKKVMLYEKVSPERFDDNQ